MSNFTVDIERQLSRLGHDIQQFVERMAPVVDESQDFTPKCDILEGDESFRMLLDLPGLKKDDIQIALRENVLTVKGERAFSPSEKERFNRRERRHGAFSRSFALPEDVNTAEIKAHFRDGVLEISMPKSDVLKGAQSIPVD